MICNGLHSGKETENPPFFATWGRLYAAVLIFQTLLVILFHFFTRAFR